MTALFAAGCGASGPLRAARAGDIATLGAALRRPGAHLDAGDARDLARATATGLIERAKPPRGVSDVSELASCARALDDALAARSGREDEIGAAAAMVRLEEGLVPADAMLRHVAVGRGDLDAAQIAWRAVGARALVTKPSGVARRQLVLDPGEDVRLAALRAAIDAGDAGDTDAVLEAARLDPNPMGRTLALRASGAIGGERVVLALHDLWATAGEAERQAIVDAWATSRALDVGGRRELGLALDAEGAPGIAAAFALSRSRDAGAAIARLERAIQKGVTRDRIFAIGVAPLSSPAIRDAIVGACGDADEAVALAALGRRLAVETSAPERAQIVKRLLAMSEGGTTLSLSARGALARAHALEVLPLFSRDRASKDLRVREASGVGLVVLGDLPGAAALLADPDERLRSRVACAILRAER